MTQEAIKNYFGVRRLNLQTISPPQESIEPSDERFISKLNVPVDGALQEDFSQFLTEVIRA